MLSNSSEQLIFRPGPRLDILGGGLFFSLIIVSFFLTLKSVKEDTVSYLEISQGHSSSESNVMKSQINDYKIYISQKAEDSFALYYDTLCNTCTQSLSSDWCIIDHMSVNYSSQRTIS